jgi:hypothetical protein
VIKAVETIDFKCDVCWQRDWEIEQVKKFKRQEKWDGEECDGNDRDEEE